MILHGKDITHYVELTMHGKLKNPIYFHRDTGDMVRLMLTNKSGIYANKGPYWVDIKTIRGGYYCYSINGKFYSAHRGIFNEIYGYLPKTIDHIDENKLNNSPSNLQEMSTASNLRKGQQKFRLMGLPPNVLYEKASDMYRVQVRFNKVLVNFGRYYDVQSASAAAETAQELQSVYKEVHNLPVIDNPVFNCAKFNSGFEKNNNRRRNGERKRVP
jgi:hypothetical protein